MTRGCTTVVSCLVCTELTTVGNLTFLLSIHTGENLTSHSYLYYKYPSVGTGSSGTVSTTGQYLLCHCRYSTYLGKYCTPLSDRASYCSPLNSTGHTAHRVPFSASRLHSRPCTFGRLSVKLVGRQILGRVLPSFDHIPTLPTPYYPFVLLHPVSEVPLSW